MAWQATRPAPDAGAPVLTGAAASAPSPAPASASPRASAPPASAPPTRDAALVAAPAAVSPVRLRVPSLGIDAPVVPAGVAEGGLMAIPEDVRRVGWYRYGPAPGATAGSAVLAGHVDSAEQGRGALYALRRVAPGSRLTVELEDGRQLAYRVTGRETITKKRLPVERLFAREGAPRLVLVTCGGPFDKARSSYRDNLIVAAEPEPTR